MIVPLFASADLTFWSTTGPTSSLNFSAILTPIVMKFGMIIGNSLANTHTKFHYNRFSRSEDTSDPRGGVKPEIRRRRRRRRNALRAVRGRRAGECAPVEGRRVGPRPLRANGPSALRPSPSAPPRPLPSAPTRTPPHPPPSALSLFSFLIMFC